MASAGARSGLRSSILSNALFPKSFLALKPMKSFSFNPQIPKSPNSPKFVSSCLRPASPNSPQFPTTDPNFPIQHIGDNYYNNYGGGGFGKGGRGNGGGGGSNSRSGGGGGGGFFAAFMMGWAVHMVTTKEVKMGLLKTVLNVVALMRECNNLRCQTLNAAKAMPVGAFRAMVMVLRCLNNVARRMSFVLLGRLIGSQKGRGGGGGCEGGVMSTSPKSKPKAKRKKTEEEKTFRRRATCYFLASQLVLGLLFWSLFGRDGNAGEGDEDELDYDD